MNCWRRIIVFVLVSCIISCIYGDVVHIAKVGWAGGTNNCEETPPFWRGDYACTNGSESGDWSDGIKYYTDNQTDSAYVLVQVNISLDGSFDCKDNVTVTVLINMVPIGELFILSNIDGWCLICGNCWSSRPPSLLSSDKYPEGLPSYNYGRINELSVQVDGVSSGSKFCLSQVVLSLIYNQTVAFDSSSSDSHLDIDAPTWFWTLVILLGAIVMVLAVVFFTLWRRSSQTGGPSGYRVLNNHEYVDPSQLEDIKIDSDQLVVQQEIGRGSFGQVFKGTWRGTEVAIKRIPANSLREAETREFLKEAFILRQLRHPNVLQVLGASVNPPCIVIEFMPRGNLFHLIHDKDVALPWPLVQKIALDVCKGMSYLHCCSPPLIHRDLKPHNLLVDDNWRVKVCDFGLSRFVENKRDMTACGTPAYAAPEVLRNADYSTSADVYSFGIVLWELLTRENLYPNMPPFQIIYTVGTQKSRPPIPSTLAPPLAELIQDCWDEDPNNRPSFMEITERLLEMALM